LRKHSMQMHWDGRLLRLRFVAAVIVRCSGDKSDKEESAGCFELWGLWVTAAVIDLHGPRLRSCRQHKYVDFSETV